MTTEVNPLAVSFSIFDSPENVLLSSMLLLFWSSKSLFRRIKHMSTENKRIWEAGSNSVKPDLSTVTGNDVSETSSPDDAKSSSSLPIITNNTPTIQKSDLLTLSDKDCGVSSYSQDLCLRSSSQFEETGISISSSPDDAKLSSSSSSSSLPIITNNTATIQKSDLLALSDNDPGVSSYSQAICLSSSQFDLPDDIWAEVLCMLPPKNIFRCKLLSKSWYNLISNVCVPKLTSSPFGLFSRVASTRKPRVSKWVFSCMDPTGRRNNNTSGQFLTSCFGGLPFTPSPNEFLDSCNGLLLFFHKRFYVCNPSTEQYLGIPKAPAIETPLAASLTFDPHFNIVWILHEPLRMFIYHSASHKWVVHSDLCLEDSVLSKGWSYRGVFIDGSLYYVSMSGHIVEFLTKQISAKAIKLPEVVEIKLPIGTIGASRGRLHYAWENVSTRQLLVWVLDESQWVLKHTISLLDFVKYSKHRFLSPYAFHPITNIIFLGHKKVGIFWYDPGSKKFGCFYRVQRGTCIFGGQLLVSPFSRNLTTLVDHKRSIGIHWLRLDHL